MEQAMQELDQYNGNVWTHILSLKREDAARLGYDNAKAWRNLLRANRNEIAAAMNIQPNHFRWYAAFHDEGKHPHVHMMAVVDTAGKSISHADGIRIINLRSPSDLQAGDAPHLRAEVPVTGTSWWRETRRAIRTSDPPKWWQRICSVPEIEQKMEQLAGQLETVKGKKSYGYLPKPVKKTVDEIVDKLEELPVVRECYGQ